MNVLGAPTGWVSGIVFVDRLGLVSWLVSLGVLLLVGFGVCVCGWGCEFSVVGVWIGWFEVVVFCYSVLGAYGCCGVAWVWS